MLSVVICTLACLLIIPTLEKYAPRFGLVDSPSVRKKHIGAIPVVGGLAIFFGLCSGYFLVGFEGISWVLIFVSSMVLLMGIFDDLKELSARVRFVFQLIAALVIVLIGDVRIESLGAILGEEPVLLSGFSSIMFTAVCIVGVINSINMIDGLDSLSGSILLLSFTALGVLAGLGEKVDASLFIFSCSGCLIAFLLFNNRLFRPKARVFLGDAGSMMLGIVLAWFFIDLTQSDSPVLTSVSAGWILGLPLLETISVMVGRLIEKRSPFEAGRDHLHHRLRHAGLSVNASVGVMVLLHATLVVIGILAAGNPENDSTLFWSFVVLTIIYFFFCRLLLEKLVSKFVGNNIFTGEDREIKSLTR